MLLLGAEHDQKAMEKVDSQSSLPGRLRPPQQDLLCRLQSPGAAWRPCVSPSWDRQLLAWVGSSFLPWDLFQSLQNLPSSHSGCLRRRAPHKGHPGWWNWSPSLLSCETWLCGLSTLLTRESRLAAPLTGL